jgi:hypothetical protein
MLPLMVPAVLSAHVMPFLREDEMAQLNGTCKWARAVMQLEANQQRAATDYHLISKGYGLASELMAEVARIGTRNLLLQCHDAHFTASFAMPWPHFIPWFNGPGSGRGRGVYFMLGRRGVPWTIKQVMPWMVAGVRLSTIGRAHWASRWTVKGAASNKAKRRKRQHYDPKTQQLQLALRRIAMIDVPTTEQLHEMAGTVRF